MQLPRHTSLYALVTLFVVLVIGIGAALRYTSSAFGTSLAPGGGLVDGLIANGISVIISVIFIAPLTAYLVSFAEERRMSPIRRAFIVSISSEIERISTFYLHQAPLYGNAVIALELSAGSDEIAGSLMNFNRYLNTLTSSILSISKSVDVGYPDLDHPLREKILKDAKLVKDMTSDIYQTFYRETSSLENTILFAIPNFNDNVTAELYQIRKNLIDYRGGLLAMISVLSGDLDPRMLVRARHAVLDFSNLSTIVETVSRKTGIIIDTHSEMNVTEQLARFGPEFQQQLTDKLVDVIVHAAEIDGKLEKIRTGTLK